MNLIPYFWYRRTMRWQKFVVGLVVGWILHALLAYVYQRWQPAGDRNADWRLANNNFLVNYINYTNYTIQAVQRTSLPKALNIEAFVDLLPYLRDQSKLSLEPTVLLAGPGDSRTDLTVVVRSPPKLIIAIPSVHRSKQNYLLGTLRELLGGFLSPVERRQVAFVVLLAERRPVADPQSATFIRQTLDGILLEFGAELAAVLVEVVLPAEVWYPPDLESVPPTFGDKPDRMYWRTKQNLDYAYLMAYVHGRYPQAKYYLQLEDDILAVKNYVSGVLRFASERRDWALCEFATLGFIGKLIHLADLPIFINVILLLHREQPVDWILNELFRVKYCPKISRSNVCAWKLYTKTVRPQHLPPLFQHEGRHSSLAGKKQGLVEKGYRRDFVVELLVVDGKPPGWRLANHRLPAGVTDAAVRDFYHNEIPLSFTIDMEELYVLEVIYEGADIVNTTAIEVTFFYVITPAINLLNGTLPFTVIGVQCETGDVNCGEATVTLVNHAVQLPNGDTVAGPATAFWHKFDGPPPRRLRVEFGRRPTNFLHGPLTLTSLRLISSG